MNIQQIINAVHKGISPYITIQGIDVNFSKKYEFQPFKLKEELTLLYDMSVTIFYDRESNNFTTTFYGWQPAPKSIDEIVSKIMKQAEEQKAPIQLPKKTKFNISDASLF
jgi:hypothetical protein